MDKNKEVALLDDCFYFNTDYSYQNIDQILSDLVEIIQEDHPACTKSKALSLIGTLTYILLDEN